MSDTKYQLWEFGYRGRKPTELFDWFKANPKVVLVDVRYGFIHPGIVWSQVSFREKLRAQYVHVRELGNKAYKDPAGRIELANPKVGVQRVLELMEQGYQPAIMCACEDYNHCHRKTVVEAIIAAVEAKMDIKSVENGKSKPKEEGLFGN